MTKILAIILTAMFLLCACEGNGVDITGMADKSYVVFNYNNQGNFFYDNGELYHDNIGRLHYVDFDSMNAVFICPYPNCPHTDREVCPSYGMSGTSIAGCTVIFDGRIYYHIQNDHYDKSGEFIKEIEVYSADIDGTNRKKEGVIDDQSIITNAIYGDGKLYFHYSKKLDNGKSESYIRCYDYGNKSLSEYGSFLECYAPSDMFCGENNGEIYFMLFYRTEEAIIDENTVVDDEYIEYISSITRVIYRKLNILTGEITEWLIPEEIKNANNMNVYATIKDGYFVYSDSKDTVVVTPDGEEYFFEGYDACNIAILNNTVFPYLSSNENKAIDLKSGELINIKLNEEGINWAYVCGYCDGKYILRCLDDVKWYDYKKVNLEIVR